VRQAIADLDRQRDQLRMAGRTFLVDVVVQAPPRFCDTVRTALEAELPTLRPGVVRCRFHLLHDDEPSAVAAVLHRLPRCQGVILKAPDLPEIDRAVHTLSETGVPVVTLVTDLPRSPRLGYVGIDNAAAGATAAFLIEQALGDLPGDVLITRGLGAFHGEQERKRGFEAAMAARSPGRRLVEVVEDADHELGAAVHEALLTHMQIVAAYSMYSFAAGNQATVDAFAAAGRACRVFVGHDLNHENVDLLTHGEMTYLLDHDLAADLRRACQMIVHFYLGRSMTLLRRSGGVRIVTPYNLPD
jgi:LacI family transcriptional regulator